MSREQAQAILALPREQALAQIMELAEKAALWDRHLNELRTAQAAQSEDSGEQTDVSPTTPSGMMPTYLKEAKKKRKKKPGRKKGHQGHRRPPPEHVDRHTEHLLETCPHCGEAVGQSIRSHSRIIEDTPPTEPVVTEHLIHGHWCAKCKKIVTPKVTDALPGATLGLHLVVLSAWLHYGVGVSVGNLVKLAANLWGLSVSSGGLTQAWKNLARVLEGDYEAIGEKIRTSAVLHADETGWRVNGVTFWLWAFATKQYCYYLIDRRRGSSVVQKVLGVLFPGILITDFWGAYNRIAAMAKQRCYFHLFTELAKVDKRNHGAPWKAFRKKLSRFMKDAVRLMERREALEAAVYERRKRRLHRRLDEIITQSHEDADAVRLIKRLKRHRDEMLTFLDYENVSPYNNYGEQQMRPAVITRKVSQQNRSKDGAKAHAIFLSLFRSAELQGLNPVEYVLELAKRSIPGRVADIIQETPVDAEPLLDLAA
jgi:transposase